MFDRSILPKAAVATAIVALLIPFDAWSQNYATALDKLCGEEVLRCDPEKAKGQSRENDEHCRKRLWACQNTGQVPLKYNASDLAIIERAYQERSIRTKTPVRDIKNYFAPVLVHLPNMICVEMFEFMGLDGGPDTTCFDKSGKNVVLHYAK